jgi:hypothetical protein
MTRRSVTEAAQRHDITLALTPTQLLLAALGAYLVLRFLRSLRR